MSRKSSSCSSDDIDEIDYNSIQEIFGKNKITINEIHRECNYNSIRSFIEFLINNRSHCIECEEEEIYNLCENCETEFTKMCEKIENGEDFYTQEEFTIYKKSYKNYFRISKEMPNVNMSLEQLFEYLDFSLSQITFGIPEAEEKNKQNFHYSIIQIGAFYFTEGDVSYDSDED